MLDYELYMGTSVSFDEFFKLKFMLQEAGIPFEDASHWDPVRGAWLQLYFPVRGENQWSDVIFHQGSYGYEEGLLEMMGCVEELIEPGEEYFDDVMGHLTAEQVFNVWSKVYNKYKEDIDFRMKVAKEENK